MRKYLVSAAIGLVAVLAGAMAAYASIPDPGGVIHGCYSNQAYQGLHALTIVDSAKTATCPNNTTAVNWNQTGPQGPPGPAGATGPAGAGKGQAVTATTEMDIPCDDSWHAATSPLSLYVSSGHTVFLSGYFRTGPVFDAANPGSFGEGFSTGRFIVDGAPIAESTTSKVQPSQLTSFTHALQLSGSHTFGMEISCTPNGGIPGIIKPTLQVLTRTVAAQELAA